MKITDAHLTELARYPKRMEQGSDRNWYLNDSRKWEKGKNNLHIYWNKCQEGNAVTKREGTGKLGARGKRSKKWSFLAVAIPHSGSLPHSCSASPHAMLLPTNGC